MSRVGSTATAVVHAVFMPFVSLRFRTYLLCVLVCVCFFVHHPRAGEVKLLSTLPSRGASHQHPPHGQSKDARPGLPSAISFVDERRWVKRRSYVTIAKLLQQYGGLISNHSRHCCVVQKPHRLLWHCDVRRGILLRSLVSQPRNRCGMTPSSVRPASRTGGAATLLHSALAFRI